jgi:hypothetical protein
MRFSVPQYIAIEDKLLGLITFRQLFLLLGAFLLSFATFKLLSGFFAILIGFLLFGLAIILGWLHVNGKPLLNALPEVFNFFFSSLGQKYLWRPVSEISTRSIEIPIIEKYFPLEAESEEDIFIKRTVVKITEPELPIENLAIKSHMRPDEKHATTQPAQPLIKYIQYSHQHTKNPFNPYRFFPLPRFFSNN